MSAGRDDAVQLVEGWPELLPDHAMGGADWSMPDADSQGSRRAETVYEKKKDAAKVSGGVLIEAVIMLAFWCQSGPKLPQSQPASST